MADEERVSLREDLGAAFDEAFAAEDAVEESAPVEEVVEEQDAEVEVESEVEGQVEEQPEDSTDEITEEETEEFDDLEPLKHWHKEDKEVFKTLPREAQEFLLRRDKEFQSSATRKQMEVSDIKRALDPVRNDLVKHGIAEADAIRRLVGAHVRLTENPRESIMWLMQQYGVNPSDILGNVEGGSESSDNAAMREIQDLKKRLKEYEERTQQERFSTVSQQIAEFEKSNEFFKQVEPEMATIARSFTMRGEPAPPLEELYEKACWMNESVRQELLARKEKEKLSKRSAQDKENISKAKRAAKSRVQPSRRTSTTAKEGEKRSLLDDLSEAYDKVTQAR